MDQKFSGVMTKGNLNENDHKVWFCYTCINKLIKETPQVWPASVTGFMRYDKGKLKSLLAELKQELTERVSENTQKMIKAKVHKQEKEPSSTSRSSSSLPVVTISSPVPSNNAIPTKSKAKTRAEVDNLQAFSSKRKTNNSMQV